MNLGTQRRITKRIKRVSRRDTPKRHSQAEILPWTEALFAAEILLLHATPVYYGLGVPPGDGSAVIIIPGFLGTDLYLMELHGWLGRIGYRPYFSGIGVNADCPNLLIQRHLNETIARARAQTGQRIHLIGHSLGGVIARSRCSSAGQRYRIRDNAGRAVPRHDDQQDCFASGGGSPLANPPGTRSGSAAGLLHWTLHLQVHQLPDPRYPRLGHGDRHLHAPRWHR